MRFHTVVSQIEAKNLVKPTTKTYFSIKWHFMVTQGQAFYSCWKADKALHDAE